MEKISVLDTDLAIIPMLIAMENRGIRIDKSYFETLTSEFKDCITDYNDAIDEVAGTHINPKSPPAVSQFLYDRGIYPKRGMSTDAGTLDKYANHEEVQWIKQCRKYRDLVEKFTINLPLKTDSQDCIHCNIKNTRVVSGRLATGNPNLMGIPVRDEDGRKIRQGFIPTDGYVYMGIDYSQIEMRIAAHLSQDSAMINAFNRGEDIHAETSMRMFGYVTKEKRYAAKRTGFGILYGISPPGLRDIFYSDGITTYTEKDCDEFISAWFRVYPGIKLYIDRVCASIRRYGYINDMFGRRRLVPEKYSTHERTREAGFRQGVNHTIQASATGIIKQAMIELWPICQELGDMVYPLLQIHDELLFEVKQDVWQDVADTFREVMSNVVELSVPVECDVEYSDKSWGDMKEVEL